MNHYNLAKTLEFLQKSLPETLLPFDLPQLADLCNCGELTPMVYYSRFLDTIIVCEYDHPQFINAYEFKGYLTDIQLNELVYECSNAKDESINQLSKLLYNADIHEIMEVHYPVDNVDNDKKLHIGDRVALFYYKQRYDDDYQRNTSDQKESDALIVTPSMIRFAANNVKDYIASKQTASLNTPEHQIADLTEQLRDTEAENKELRKKIDKLSECKQEEGQGDSLLILGAVMSCIEDVVKKNYTQDLLVQSITKKYGNISGISESTLKKKFPESRSYLNQRLTPK